MSLVGWWPLDGDAKDRVGGYHGTVNGASITNGKIGNALDFDGSNDSVNISSIPHLTRFSISAWVKTSNTNNNSIFSNWNDNGVDERSVLLGVDSDSVRVSIDASGTYNSVTTEYSNQSISDNDWHHIIATYDGTKISIYIDSKLDTTATHTSGVFNSSADWEIGSFSNNEDWNLNGQIDDVRLYDHAISEKKIQKLSQAKVLHYKFNEDGNVADASGHGNDGELNGPTYTTENKIGSGAYDFSGSNGIRIENNSKIQLTGDLTISFWAKPFNISSARQNPINKDYEDEFTMTAETDGGLSFYCNDSDSRYNNYEASNIFQNDNEWVHVTAVRDVGNEVVWYRNGEYWETKSWSGGNPIAGGDDLIIGDGYTNPYNGILDDVRFYASALSESEVKEIYEQRASIDSGGNFHSHELKEPQTRHLINDETFSADGRIVPSSYTPKDTDYLNWVESDDTLGNIYLRGWVYLTNSSIYPDRFEFTKENNDKGVTATFDANWTQGWNKVFQKLTNWQSPSNTPWENMDRLEIYHNTQDSTESVRFKNLQIEKYADNELIESKIGLNTNGSLKTKTVSEIGPAPESLVGWWPLDGDTRDYAGSANGTNNGATVTSGLGQSAYNFNGTSDYVDVPPEAVPQGNQITISIWSYGGANQPQDDSVLEAKDSNNNRVLNIHHPWGNGNIYWDTDNGGSGTDRIYKSANSSDYKGRWAHWVFTKNANTGYQKIYLDGEEWHSGTGKTGTLGEVTSFKLGSYTSGNNSWDGKLQDVRLYDRALTSSEIETLYNLTDPRTDQQVMQSDNGTVHTKNQLDELL